MTESLDKEKPKEKEKVESKPSKLIAYPQICAVENDDSTGFDIEVYLPGVDKDTVKLKMDSEYIQVSGTQVFIVYVVLLNQKKLQQHTKKGCLKSTFLIGK